jgi:competence protein ComEA
MWLSAGYIAVVGILGLISLWPKVNPPLVSAQSVKTVPPLVLQAQGLVNSAETLRPGPALVLGVVNINQASIAELDSLPGVGSALAKRIIAGRPYQRLEDLDRIKGVGPKLLERLRPWTTL